MLLFSSGITTSGHIDGLTFLDASSSALSSLIRRHRLLADGPVNVAQDQLERLLHVGRLQRGRLDVGKAFRLGEALRVAGGDGPEVPQVGLVADEHDSDVGVGMVAQLLEPSADVLKGGGFAHVIDQDRAERPTVVGACDCTVPLLACCVPDLRFDDLALNLQYYQVAQVRDRKVSVCS